MLSNEWYGFPGADVHAVLRLVLEGVPEAEELVYDITDLILSGYFDQDDDLVAYGVSLYSANYSTMARTIVLTEGRTDSWIVSESMAVLYPHLFDYYSFMDFDAFRASGGAGNLVNLVKAFSGAGIVNRTVALFDNDTAANTALRALSYLSLPNSISVVQLPELEFLKSYPTIGPAGMARTNVNGVATSIELFLSSDVLKHEEYGLHPVQWTGFDAGLRQYQGEVIEKSELHRRYKKKLDRARQTTISDEEQDWSAMHILFAHLFSTFHEIDRDEIFSLAHAHFSS